MMSGQILEDRSVDEWGVPGIFYGRMQKENDVGVYYGGTAAVQNQR